MAPIRWYLMRFGEKKRKEALAKSSVKIKGNDVVASWKIMVGLFLVPASVNLISFIFLVFRSQVYASTLIGRLFVSFIFSIIFWAYLVYCVQLLNGVKTNLRIVLIRFFVIIYRNTIAKLLKTRKDLKRQVKDVMDKYSTMNQHSLIKRRSFYANGDPLDIDFDQIFGELNDIMIS